MDECIWWIIIVLTYISIGVVIIMNSILYFLKYKNDYADNLIFKEIEQSINGKLILSLSAKESCDGDEEKLILGTWDGIVEGCECRGNFFENICSSEQTDNGCISIYSSPPINYTVFNSTYFCAKKSKLNYKELIKTDQVISKNKNCPKNYKLCGILDTLGRKFCAKNDEPCPLNTENIKSQILNLFNDYQNVPNENNNSNYNLNNNNTNAKIISSIKISQYKPCINPNEKFWDYHYALEPSDQKCTSEIKGDKYDKRYEQISDTIISKLQLYDENLITNKLVDIDEISLKRIQKDTVSLFTINFFGFDSDELEKSEFDYEKLLTAQTTIKDNVFYQSIISWVVLGSFILFFLSKLFIKIAVGPDWCQGELNIGWLRKLLLFLFWIFFYGSPASYLITFSYILYYIQEIKSILNLQTSDEFTTTLLKMLIEESSNNYKHFLAMVIVNSIIIISLIIMRLFLPKNIEDELQEMFSYSNEEKNKKNNGNNSMKLNYYEDDD